MKRFSGNILILLLALLLTFTAAACQSSASDAVAEDVQIQAAPEAEEIAVPAAEETAEEAVSAETESAETPVSVTYEYMGHELLIEAYDGYALISYPAAASESEVGAFLSSEAERYGITDVTYSFTGPGSLRLDYPAGISAEERKEAADTLASDLMIYVTPVPEIEPETAVTTAYAYDGYKLSATIGDGRTVISYPEFIADADVEGFFAFENAKNDFASLGVKYTLSGPGTAVLTYPSAYTKEEVKAELDRIVSDLTAYIAVVPAAVPAPVESVDTVISEVYSYNGYTLSAVITDGRTVLNYPKTVSDEDVVQFFALENERYGYSSLGVVYTIEEPGVTVFEYPESIVPAAVASELDKLVSDLIVYITPAPKAVSVTMPEPAVEPAEEPVAEEPAVAEEPIVRTYRYAGFELTAEIATGTTVIDYPAVATDDEVNTFFAIENEKYGLGDLGVYYTLEGDGKAVFTYPEEYSKETVAAELDMLVDDLIVYITTPAPETAAAEPVETDKEEMAEPAPTASSLPEDPVSYPFGVEPIVKASGDEDGFNLYIVHTNDVHGRITAGEDGSMGYAKLSTLLDMARSVTSDILLLDGGDTLHGTNLANMFEGQTVLEIMDAVGYDAMVPGNHDFNYGSDRLLEAARWAEDNASFRILSANITDEEGYLLLQPYQIYDYNGFKVCVIGLTTPDTKTKSHPANTVGIEFMNEAVIDNAQAALDIANDLADFVIVLGHIGIVPDGDTGITSELICQSLDGIDLFIDAHSHTVMDGGEMVNGTLIVSTGQYMNNLGIVPVEVDAAGNAEIGDAFLLPASEVLDPSTGTLLQSLGITEVPDDPAIDAYVEAKQAELDEMLGEVVARIPVSLNGEREDVRTKKTNLSALICEAMTAESGADFTIINGGGIRASLEAGDVTLGDINNVLPFTNIITVCEITPADVYAALEHGYSLLPEQNGAFSQTDLKVVYSASAPAGERIRRVYFGDTLLDRNDNETVYRVASNDFMAAGGDGYTMFGRVLSEGGMLNEVFCDYLSKLYPVK